MLRCADPHGPRPQAGQFYMLSAASGGAGERASGRSSRGRSASCAPRPRPNGDELQFLIEDVGPGTKRLCELDAGETILLIVGPLGIGFAPPREGRAAAAGRRRGRDRAAGDLAGRARGGRDRSPTLLGFRDAAHAAGAALLRDAAVATDDGSVGHHGLVTELLADELEDRADEVEVYACGPPAMLEAVRALCAERGVPAQLALESGMACGFGACFGCVVPTRDGYLRLCVDGPVLDAEVLETAAGGGSRTLTTDFCGIELAHPIINASGTFDAIAAAARVRRRAARAVPVRRVRLEDRHARAAPGQSAAAPVGARRRA